MVTASRVATPVPADKPRLPVPPPTDVGRRACRSSHLRRCGERFDVRMVHRDLGPIEIGGWAVIDDYGVVDYEVHEAAHDDGLIVSVRRLTDEGGDVGLAIFDHLRNEHYLSGGR